jgi:hypothetical protein
MRSSRLIVATALAGAFCCGCNGERPGQPDAPRGIVDATLAAKCVVEFGCFLSHPGLGSSGSATAVDLATCVRTTTSHDGPYEDGTSRSEPTGSSAETKKSRPASPDECAQIAGLVAAITVDDTRSAQEAAEVDTSACFLSVTCPPAAEPVLRVQRQTTTGGSRVEQLIRAVQ